jgi:hypothetical protein
VEVKIFGKAHKLHRLTYADVFELLGQVAESMKDKLKTQPSIILGLDTMGPLVGDILRRSFPSFDEWDDLPLDHTRGLLEIVVDENDLPGIIENFTKLRDRVGKILPQQSRKN